MIDFLETMKILIVQLHFFNKIKLKLHFYKINNIFDINKKKYTYNTKSVFIGSSCQVLSTFEVIKSLD